MQNQIQIQKPSFNYGSGCLAEYSVRFAKSKRMFLSKRGHFEEQTLQRTEYFVRFAKSKRMSLAKRGRFEEREIEQQ